MNGAMNRGIRTSWVQMVLSALLALCYTACSAPLTVEGGQRVTSELLAAIQQGELAALDQFYADKFFARMPREEWIYTLKVTQEKLGPIKNYALISSNLESSFLGAEKLKLTYRVQYEQVAFRHVFTMVEQNGRARVLSHEVLGDVAE